jgi:uncharacterized protein (DUF433 family)
MLEPIQKTANVLGGEACVGQRRLAVWMLVRAKQLGLTDEQIRTRYQPEITKSELAAAWKYYHENRDEVDRAIRKYEED